MTFISGEIACIIIIIAGDDISLISEEFRISVVGYSTVFSLLLTSYDGCIAKSIWTKCYCARGRVFESHLSGRKMSFTSELARLALRRHFGEDSLGLRSTPNAHPATTHSLRMRA